MSQSIAVAFLLLRQNEGFLNAYIWIISQRNSMPRSHNELYLGTIVCLSDKTFQLRQWNAPIRRVRRIWLLLTFWTIYGHDLIFFQYHLCWKLDRETLMDIFKLFDIYLFYCAECFCKELYHKRIFCIVYKVW